MAATSQLLGVAASVGQRLYMFLILSKISIQFKCGEKATFVMTLWQAKEWIIACKACRCFLPAANVDLEGY